ncbi:MAG: acyltransferase [Mesonia sp.]|uniref:acyltransferase family protein n=1 Tax=Mesonia sp. TaxID=1960830 RepID=UPI0032424D03
MRIEQLTFTRFLAAISIVIFHYGKNVKLFYNNYTSFIFEQANVGVSFFFVLSGFVMIIAYGNRENISFLNYIKNRLARIYPVYLLAIVLLLTVKLFKIINNFDLILNLLMIESWFSNKALSFNFTGWSLSVEMFFYATFPLLLNHFYSKKTLKNTTIFIVFLFILSQLIYLLFLKKIMALPFYSIKDLPYHPIMHLNEFLIGNLTGIYFKYKLKLNLGLIYHNGLLAIIFAPFLVFLPLSNNKLTNLMSKKTFVFLGEISFVIYFTSTIWHIFSDYRMNKYFGLDNKVNFT